MITKKGVIFLNRYQLFVGSPGSNKSIAINFCNRLIRATGLDIPMSKDSVTAPAFLDNLAQDYCKRAWGRYPTDTIHHMVAHLSEYSIFDNGKDRTLQVLLTKTWDNEPYSESRRTKGDLTIGQTYVTILGATQPERFASTFNRDSWSGGYLSRMNIVYHEGMLDDSHVWDMDETWEPGAVEARQEEFNRKVTHDVLFLLAEIKDKHSLYLRADNVGNARFLKWYREERVATEMTHPQCIDMNSRRPMHIRKDAGLFALARGDFNGFIEERDINKALELRYVAEKDLVTMIDKIAHATSSDAITATWDYTLRMCQKTHMGCVDKPVVMGYLTTRVKHHEAEAMYRYMTENGILELVTSGPHPTLRGVNQTYVVPKVKGNPFWTRNETLKPRKS